MTGETCVIAPGQLFCRFGAEGAMAAGARVERDLETTKVLYSAACFRDAGCTTARDTDEFPFAGLSISGSVVTVRENTLPRVAAGGALVAPGWRTEDAPLAFSASDGVGISRVRVLVDGAEASVVRPACDYHAMVPCAQQPTRSLRLGSRLSDGRHTVRVEATDAAGNTNRVDRPVAVDRFGPVLTFVPSSGGRRIGVFADDPGAGVTGGTIEVRSRKAKRFRTLKTRLERGRLVARLARGSRRGLTIRASATDAVGHRSSITGAPVRLRAGFGRRQRASTRTGLSQRLRVRGWLAGLSRRPARRAPGRRAAARPHRTARASGVNVAVVIPNYNGARWLPGVLESVAAQTVAPADVLVVDDGSTDGSAELAAGYDGVRVLALGSNGGFARAANAGVAAVTAEAVAFVNTDVVLAPDWLERAAGALEPGDAAVATKMVDLEDPSILYSAGDVLRRDGACEQRGRFERDSGAFDAPGEVFSACAGAALYRRAAVVEAGGFDERLGMYLEDVELGLRLRLAGWGCRWEPRAVARHAGGGSSGGPGPRWSSATRCCSWRATSASAGCRSWPTASSGGRGMPRAAGGCAST